MDRKAFNEQVSALADVAESVGRLSAVFGEQWDCDKTVLRETVLRMSGLLFDPLMPRGLAAEQTAAPQAEKRVTAPRAQKKVAVDVVATVKAPDGAPASGPEKAAAVCVECGKEYSKTGPAQKRCKECAEERSRAHKTAWLEAKRNPAATADRLERIKAVDKRMDTIGDGGETGV